MEIPWDAIEKIAQLGLGPVMFLIAKIIANQLKAVKQELEKTKKEIMEESAKDFLGVNSRLDKVNGKIQKHDDILLDHHGKIGELKGEVKNHKS